MGVTLGELDAIHPTLYHMAEDGSWPSIAKHGLLSTTALLDLFEVSGDERTAIEAMHRPVPIPIAHPRYGVVVIRDQAPMDDSGLRRALKGTGLEPRDWYLILNKRVFFWPTEARLERMLNAANYRARPHTVLVIPSRPLLAAYWDRLVLSPINSGATKPMPAPRGPGTFQPPSTYPFTELAAKRSRSDVIVEVAVDYSVPDITTFVTEVQRRQGSRVLEVDRRGNRLRS